MSNKGACKICRVGRYWNDSKKIFNEEHLCFDCSIICDLNIQHLIPASERKESNMIWPRTSYKSNYLKSGSILIIGSLARTNNAMNNYRKGYLEDTSVRQ